MPSTDPVHILTEDEWQKLANESHSHPDQVTGVYWRLMHDVTGTGEAYIRQKENALLKLAALYKQLKKVNELAELIRASRQLLVTFPKAKMTKLLKTLVDQLSELPGATSVQVTLVKELIDWAVTEKRLYLRQSLETRLVALYIDAKQYTDALALIGTLLKELKRLDDKLVLIEVQLLESRVGFALRNVAKSRAALTSARTTANAIYCPPVLQAALDMQSGILHAEEKDFKTGYSYFYESLEAYSTLEDSRALLALKYMLLCKIMLNNAEDVHSITHGKLALRYAGPQVEAMRAIAKAYQSRSLKEFEAALFTFKAELGDDPIVRSHLSALYDQLLEQNLLRLIEPFSRVEVAHVASLVGLPLPAVEAKLSQMILDRVLSGVLDQNSGSLELFDTFPEDETYTSALETIKHMGSVVESLFQKASKLS